MNASHNTNMSPNTFRRLLVAHGRTTTPGVFEASVTYKPDEIMKELIDKKKIEAEHLKADVNEADTLNKKIKSIDSEHHVAKHIVENYWPPRGALINPPLSKIKSTKPTLASSYSFYTRPFKVHGKEAWEFAMRGLGSVDTLLNRYGYVEPMWRGETFHTPLEMQQKEANATRAENKAGKVAKVEDSHSS